MDNVESAVRTIARAFGHGCAWEARVTRGEASWQPSGETRTAGVTLDGTWHEDGPSAISDGLPECAESETLERAGDSVSNWLGRQNARPESLTPQQRRARARLSPAERESLWAWERDNPLNKAQGRNPYRTRELEHWKRYRSGDGVKVVRPQHLINEPALVALCGIAEPMRSTLLLYALQDAKYWPTVKRYALAALPADAHTGVLEGMVRLMMHPAKRQRAKALKMRESDWDAMSRRALGLMSDWLHRAADAFVESISTDTPPPITGTQGEGTVTETWWRPPAIPAPVRSICPQAYEADRLCRRGRNS